MIHYHYKNRHFYEYTKFQGNPIMTELYFLPAAGGDFLWLRYGPSCSSFHNIIIDSGYKNCCLDFCAIINHICKVGESVEAILLTHYDNDHIGGFLNWLRLNGRDMPEIRKIYFNTGQGIAKAFGLESNTPTFEQYRQYKSANCNYSVSNAYSIMELLEAKRLLPFLCSCQVMKPDPVSLTDGATIRFISPSKQSAIQYSKMFVAEPRNKDIVNYGGSAPRAESWEDLDALMEARPTADTSISNGGSLAFLFDYEDVHLAFLGDAHASICVDGLRLLGYTKEHPYRADLVKLSHHGSARNLSLDLLDLLSCDDYLISTTARKVERIHKMGIALLLHHHTPIRLYWNCHYPNLFTAQDEKCYLETGALTMYRLDLGESTRIVRKEGLTLYGRL